MVLPTVVWGVLVLAKRPVDVVEFQPEAFEKLATAFASGKMRNRTEVKAVAKMLGMAEDQVENWRGNIRMGKRVAELLKTRAIMATANAMGSIEDKAFEERDVPAFIAVAKVGGFLQSQGVQVNVAVDQRRQGGDPEHTVAFINTFRDRQKAGLLRRIAAEDAVIVPPDEPSIP